jgi:hypothetical protein
MCMQYPDLLLQHPDENTCNIRLIQIKHLEYILETYVHSYCNMCNINLLLQHPDLPIPIRSTYNIPLKHLKHLKHIFATCAFIVTSPCYFGMEARRRVEFTGVELTSGAELAAPMEKGATSPAKKASRLSVGAVGKEEVGQQSSGVAERVDGGHLGAMKSVVVVQSWCCMSRQCSRDAACCNGAGTAACSRCSMPQRLRARRQYQNRYYKIQESKSRDFFSNVRWVQVRLLDCSADVKAH